MSKHTHIKLLLSLVLTILVSQYLPAQTTWGIIDHNGEPWVKNVSRPYSIERGLEARHIALWASHGRYFDNNERKWRWQRPALFGTTEDLYTQTIVIPYLIPMLENAGAVVFTPRERDWQRNEVIIDNDRPLLLGNYQEKSQRQQWLTAPEPGFAFHAEPYHDEENPFEAGTARMIETTHSKSTLSTISYQPDIPHEGSYSVYVSYQTVENSVDDAHYTVWHKGQKTDFFVNQQMGGSTWVYLGTFEFDKGSSEFNRVVLSNQSKHKGYVTADAVRFGGGMGNIERGGAVSGLPRCLEGARYAAQWAGMPYNVYSSKQGANDYGDDINVRSYMSNWLGGGSCYMPDSIGKKVPFELSLAIQTPPPTCNTALASGTCESSTTATTPRHEYPSFPAPSSRPSRTRTSATCATVKTLTSDSRWHDPSIRQYCAISPVDTARATWCSLCRHKICTSPLLTTKVGSTSAGKVSRTDRNPRRYRRAMCST